MTASHLTTKLSKCEKENLPIHKNAKMCTDHTVISDNVGINFLYQSMILNENTSEHEHMPSGL